MLFLPATWRYVFIGFVLATLTLAMDPYGAGGGPHGRRPPSQTSGTAYTESILTVPAHGVNMDDYTSRLLEQLRTTFHFSNAHVALQSNQRLNDEILMMQIRSPAHVRRFIYLGGAEGHILTNGAVSTIHGWAMALPLQRRAGPTTFALFSVFPQTHEGQRIPTVWIHGFAKAHYVDGVERVLEQTLRPQYAPIEKGDVLSTHEVFRDISRVHP